MYNYKTNFFAPYHVYLAIAGCEIILLPTVTSCDALIN